MQYFIRIHTSFDCYTATLKGGTNVYHGEWYQDKL